MLAARAPCAVADVLYLANGGTVEGQILATSEQFYKVRTVVGTLTLPADAVVRVESTPSPFEEYEQKRQRVPDAPSEHVTLADWCAERGLTAERRVHLQRALELDGNYEPARRALGFVRVGPVWVDGRTVIAEANGEEPPPPDAREAPPDRADDQIIAAIQGTWARRIRAIKTTQLDSSLERLMRAGRRQILEIKDPLAILPLVRVLSRGSLLCRHVMVEALTTFHEDEATLNLAVTALTDPSRDIRDMALTELVRRRDARVTPHFREALRANSDAVIRNAAIALGQLKAAEAVPNLIDLLTGRAVKLVELTPAEYFGALARGFNVPTVLTLGRTQRVVHPPQIGWYYGGAWGPFPETTYAAREVTVYRTEVLEALKEITGQNFGFEAAAWRRWYEEHKP